jgi:glutamate---cysteine ligase / carboxylate-amine ligase
VPVSSITRSPVDANGAWEDPGEHPSWARWNGQRQDRYTLGVEDEVMLLDPPSWSLAQSGDRVLAGLSNELASHASPETHAAVIELTSSIHTDVNSLRAELAWLRTQLGNELDAVGLAAAAAGTHPLTLWHETVVSAAARYRDLGDSMRVLARREPTLALHVHVGIPEAEDATRVLNGLRHNAPVLLALAANSPFWQGRDSGFASARAVIFQAFPQTGLPRFFEDYADYTTAVDALIASDAVPDPSFLWWDVRLQPALGTVEVRVMEAQSTLGEVAPLVALIQSLARCELEVDCSPRTPTAEILAENRFLAARDGMDARLIDPTTRRLIPVREMLDTLVVECRDHALALGCADALERVPRLATANGAARQRAFAAGNRRLAHLVANLADRFVPPAWAAAPTGGAQELL